MIYSDIPIPKKLNTLLINVLPPYHTVSNPARRYHHRARTLSHLPQDLLHAPRKSEADV